MKIGLALGSGGPKGLSHIGVLKVLLEHGIKPEVIAGSSIGALVGGAYAKLRDINEVERIASSSDMMAVLSVLFDPTLKMGLVKGKKVIDFLLKHIGDSEVSLLSPIFYAVATDFSTGEPFIFKKGSLITAIRASISIPIFFQPVEFEGRLLMDGGLSMQVPVEPLKNYGVDFVIAVNLQGRLSKTSYRKPSKFNFYNIFSGSIDILQFNLAKENCKLADITLYPDVFDIGWEYFWKPSQVIERGEIAARKEIGKILEIIEKV